MVVDKKTGLRIAFMGTPEFSVPILDALVTAGEEGLNLENKYLLLR